MTLRGKTFPLPFRGRVRVGVVLDANSPVILLRALSTYNMINPALPAPRKTTRCAQLQ